jgi:alpha-galactosidase
VWATGKELYHRKTKIQKDNCLDITHPEAAKWLHDLIDTIANDWGYEMIKIDFVAWSFSRRVVIMTQQFHPRRFTVKDWR